MSSRGAGERHCSSEEEEQETEDAALKRRWEVAPGSLLQKEPSSRGPGGMDLDACTCGDQELAVVTGWEDNGLEGRLMNFIVG